MTRSVQKYFDTQSSRWSDYYGERGSTLSHLDLTARLALATDMLRAACDEMPGPVAILDAGCGTGEGTSRLDVPRARVLAGDLSVAMVDRTIQQYPSTRGCVLDIGALPLSTGSMDIVLALGVLEYITEYRQALRECRRTLKLGGNLVLSIPNRASWFRRAHRVERAATLPLRWLKNRLSDSGDDLDASGQQWPHMSWTLPRCIALLEEAGFHVVDFRLATYGWLLPRAAKWSSNLALCRWMNDHCDGSGAIARQLACTAVIRARAVGSPRVTPSRAVPGAVDQGPLGHWTSAMTEVARGVLSGVDHLRPGRHEIVERAERADRLYFLPRPEIDTAVRQRLASLLKHAAATVPHYRALVDGQKISEDTALDVLHRLPVLTKETIRAQGDRLTSESPGTRIRVNTSGGSTGEPIRLLQDAEMDRKSRSYELLFMKWARHRPGEPHVLIWGVPEEAFGRSILWRERAFRFVHNETYLNCHRITDALLDEWVRKINAIRPTLIEAYVDALHELSLRILKTGVSIVSPRGIVTSAGVLTPAASEVIRRAFRAPIINRYGSREVSNVACSCGVGQELHVNEAWSYLEVVDEEGRACPPGVEGDILVTLFGNRTMPLIRYRIEDRGIWASGDCPCGRRTRRLAAVSGRRTDYLVTADGTRINGVAIATYTALAALHNLEGGVRQFQYRQRRQGHVTLAIVPGDGVARDSLLARVEAAVSSLGHMFKGITVDVEIEGEILPSNSGKLRYVVNELQGD